MSENEPAPLTAEDINQLALALRGLAAERVGPHFFYQGVGRAIRQLQTQTAELARLRMEVFGYHQEYAAARALAARLAEALQEQSHYEGRTAASNQRAAAALAEARAAGVVPGKEGEV